MQNQKETEAVNQDMKLPQELPTNANMQNQKETEAVNQDMKPPQELPTNARPIPDPSSARSRILATCEMIAHKQLEAVAALQRLNGKEELRISELESIIKDLKSKNEILEQRLAQKESLELTELEKKRRELDTLTKEVDDMKERLDPSKLVDKEMFFWMRHDFCRICLKRAEIRCCRDYNYCSELHLNYKKHDCANPNREATVEPRSTITRTTTTTFTMTIQPSTSEPSTSEQKRTLKRKR